MINCPRMAGTLLYWCSGVSFDPLIKFMIESFGAAPIPEQELQRRREKIAIWKRESDEKKAEIALWTGKRCISYILDNSSDGLFYGQYQIERFWTIQELRDRVVSIMCPYPLDANIVNPNFDL